jgi:hypothetical chaperone protein
MHCGLDFGTSNSTLATVNANGTPRLAALEDGRSTLPSAIFFDFQSDTVHFGRRAQAEYTAGTDGRLMRSLKSILGTQLIEESVRIKKRVLPFIEILGLFVAEVKARGETESGALFDRVVVGRPVQFVDDDAVADRRAQNQLEGAVRAQGFAHIEFQYEPIAAALDYEQQVSAEELGLVIDLGGGTSDFSIVRVSPTRARSTDRQGDILATSGVHIGGTDFDRLLSMAKIMPVLGLGTPTKDGKRQLPIGPYYDLATWHRIHRLYAPEVLTELRQTAREAKYPARVAQLSSIIRHREGHTLATTVEAGKIALSDAELAEISFTGGDVSLNVPVTRLELATALERSIDRITTTIGETLRQASLAASAIDTLILTGGSTQIPVIMARLRALFPAARFVATDAFGSVGLGLALDAKRKFG